ncbi:MAG: radical SAM family heme chaperone HemW [Candidatus Melainabacteria bacterium]|nr:radical SAM family heme chaperone HemW [Candidatus Melainabacteria bacterium]
MIANAYIHIPFCASKCVYCDFYVELAKYGRQAAYVEALNKEIALRYQQDDSNNVELPPLKSIYIGGGTPSLLEASVYQQVFETIEQYQPFSPNAERTLEINPNRLASTMADYKAVGFNRVSIGIQSFNPLELKKLSRQHSAEEAISTVYQAKKAGFINISIDLMYGIPLQTLDSWEATLAQAIALPIEHISLYGLQLEAGTPLETLVHKAKAHYPLPTDEACLAMYQLAIDRLTQAGFHQYEVSNFARNGLKSTHNLAYWQGKPFWGFGAGATGFVSGVRYENSTNLDGYIANPLEMQAETVVSALEQLENSFIFGLRLTEGIDIEAIEEKTDPVLWGKVVPVIEKAVGKGQLHHLPSTGFLAITPEWFPKMNGVLADFVNLS